VLNTIKVRPPFSKAQIEAQALILLGDMVMAMVRNISGEGYVADQWSIVTDMHASYIAIAGASTMTMTTAIVVVMLMLMLTPVVIASAMVMAVVRVTILRLTIWSIRMW